jgi:hypothetical protein
VDSGDEIRADPDPLLFLFLAHWLGHPSS